MAFAGKRWITTERECRKREREREVAVKKWKGRERNVW
jgi:hypothetical protein